MFIEKVKVINQSIECLPDTNCFAKIAVYLWCTTSLSRTEGPWTTLLHYDSSTRLPLFSFHNIARLVTDAPLHLNRVWTKRPFLLGQVAHNEAGSTETADYVGIQTLKMTYNDIKCLFTIFCYWNIVCYRNTSQFVTLNFSENSRIDTKGSFPSVETLDCSRMT